MISMYDYIVRQPAILAEVFVRREAYQEVLAQILRTHSVKKIIFTGSGTSNHVAHACSLMAEKYLDVESSAPFPTQFIGSKILEPSQTLVVGISQSGNSISTLDALLYAKEKGCITLAFSQDETSALVSLCDYFMPHVCEKELVPPETQGYTSALLEWIVAFRYLIDRPIESLTYDLEALRKVIHKSEEWVRENLHDLVRYSKMWVAGSGLHYVSAREGSLKMSETIRRPIPSYELEEFAHFADLGLEDEDCLFAIVRTKRDQEVVDLASQITSRIYAFDEEFFGVDLDQDLSLLFAIIPFQLAGCIVAEAVGNDTSKYPYEIENISHGEGFIFRS